MALSIIAGFIVFLIIAMLWTEGLWGNAITFVNTLLAALVAMSWFEPAADFLEREVMGSWTYLLDFVSLWGVFCFTFLILRTTTDQISKHRVRFRLPVELGGNILFSLLTAVIVVSFFEATLHTAPLARTAVFGSFQKEPLSGNAFGMAPGRKWLGYVQSRSRGALSAGREFDPKSEFVIKYGQRRQDLYDHMKKTQTMLVK
jgi:hypothetical protein